jgi:hypothetical protein
VLRLIDSVGGTDDAVAELQKGLVDGLREDLRVTVAALPRDRIRPGLDRATVADLLFVLLGWRGYVALVLESGWTPEQYANGIAESLTHLLLPDAPT